MLLILKIEPMPMWLQFILWVMFMHTKTKKISWTCVLITLISTAGERDVTESAATETLLIKPKIRALVEQAQHIVRKVVLNNVFGALMSWRSMLANMVVEIYRLIKGLHTSAVVNSIKGDGLLTDPQLYRLACRLGNDCTQLGALLRIDRAVVEQVLHDFREIVPITHELLKIWRAHHGKDNTGMVDELCSVVSEAGRTDLVETIKCDIAASACSPYSGPPGNSATSTNEGLSNAIELLNNRYLLELAKRLGNVYRMIGGLLRVKKIIIKKIERKSKTLVDINYNVLIIWRNEARRRTDDVGMVGEMCAAFSTHHKNDVVEMITADLRKRGYSDDILENGHKLPPCGLLDDPFMCRVALELGNIHQQLGLCLGLDQAVIDQIVYDYKTLPDITLEVLVHWRDEKQNNKDTATMVDHLCTVFNDLGQRCIADKIVAGEYIGE